MTVPVVHAIPYGSQAFQAMRVVKGKVQAPEAIIVTSPLLVPKHDHLGDFVCACGESRPTVTGLIDHCRLAHKRAPTSKEAARA